MESRVFKIEEEHRPKASLTISTDACLGGIGKVHFFSLGPYTDISPERYDCPALYIGAGGQADFVLGGGREQDVRKKATGCAREISLFARPGWKRAGYCSFRAECSAE